MESSSHITGGEDDGGEGCNSCESGWTMYLASPMHMQDHDGHDDDAAGSGKSSRTQGSSVDDGYGYMISRGNKQGCQDHADADDDDSLASDASTGPAKVKSPSSLPEHQHGKDDDDDDDDDDENHHRGKEEQEEDGSKFAASSRKKAAAGNGKVDQGGGGEGNSSRRGHSKRGGNSSRRRFFLW